MLNVNAGSGSYEPADRYVVAAEPSITMRQQRLTNILGGSWMRNTGIFGHSLMQALHQIDDRRLYGG